MTIKKLSILILLCLTTMPAHAGQVVDKVVAKVDDQVITESDIREALKMEQSGLLQGESGKGHSASRADVISRLVDEKIFASELDLQKITVTDNDVDDAVNSIIASHQSTLEKLKAALKTSNIPFDKFREKIRNDLRRRQFVQQVIYPHLRMSDVELEDFYNKHKNAFQGYEKIRYQQILLTPLSVPAGTALMDFAGKLCNQLRQGGNFTEAAKKYSKGPFAEQGGDGGLVDTASLRPDLAGILTALPLNGVSDPMPVASDEVFLFKVIDHKNPGIRPFGQVKDTVRQAYMNEKIGAEFEKYIAQAKDRHFVEIKN